MPHPHSPTWATPTDHAELADVIFDAVRNGPSLYTEAQRAVWVPERKSGAEWDARLAAKDIVLARDGNRIIGFNAQPLLTRRHISPHVRRTGYGGIHERRTFTNA